MPEEPKDPQGETPITPPVTEPPVTTPEPPVEEWDKDRAANTINNFRKLEKETYKPALKELEQLRAEKQKNADAQLSETERLQKERDTMAAENAKIKSDLLRREVIDEVGLPATFASRLQGATKEELLADAKELAKTLPQLKVAPKVPVTNPTNANVRETELQQRERLFGKQSNVFDIEHIREHGGGVLDWTTKKSQ